MTVQELRTTFPVSKRSARFLAFRTVPAFVVALLLISIGQQQNLGSWTLRASIVIALLFGHYLDVIGIFKKSNKVAIRFIHGALFFWYIILAIIFCFVAELDLRWLAPDLENLRDSLWAGLIIGIGVAIFIKLDSTKDEPVSLTGETVNDDEEKYIWKCFRKVNKHFRIIIFKISRQYAIEPLLIYSIVIFEDMNRPWLIRFIEKVVNRFSDRSLTVGIAQVKSPFPLSDKASIERMGQLIGERKGKKENVSNEDIVAFYNNDRNYVQQVMLICSVLRKLSEADSADRTSIL
ncbi:hypothetical protein [Arcanobacterium phocae]|uniref:hypothetical protein n=1 Tax=Arcanobacterium phocae TaxID=131112 RepID=UPI001C0EFBC1|nr:hypothetical protein [Arcanobacterium phocae]